MNAIFSYLHDIKLTLTQWILLSMAAIIAGLVAAFRIQGSRLHNVQVQLLHQQFGHSMEQQDARVEAAKSRFEAALHSYQVAQDE